MFECSKKGSRLFNPEKTLTAREFTQQQGSNGSGGGGSSSGEQRPKGAMSGQLRKIDFLQSLERASTMGSAMIRAAAVEEADDPRLRYSKSAGLPSQVVTPSKKARLPPLQGGSPYVFFYNYIFISISPCTLVVVTFGLFTQLKPTSAYAFLMLLPKLTW